MPDGPRHDLIKSYCETRDRTDTLAAELSPEDQMLQSMPAASPTKWHRAHTTWFFETFVLAPNGIAPVEPRFGRLFNSYYEAAGPRHPRAQRGILSRPSCDEIARYRAAIDARVVDLVLHAPREAWRAIEPVVRLGIAHEEQHQELVLTDILHALSQSSLSPSYRRAPRPPGYRAGQDPEALRFVPFEGGIAEIGAADAAFAFDSERPRHPVWLEPYSLADRLLTVQEMKAFIADGGYRTPTLWLSEGWELVRAQRLEAPLYARVEGGSYVVFGLDGPRQACDDEPVSHVSFYEAEALARYLGGRLPTEAEWESASSHAPRDGNFLEGGALTPRPADAGAFAVRQLFGDAWEWTRSSYEPYPGFRPQAGALGEYNGKFMVNQIVLRGGSCLTPANHVRPSYRNYWSADTRFQATGVRIARDA